MIHIRICFSTCWLYGWGSVAQLKGAFCWYRLLFLHNMMWTAKYIDLHFILFLRLNIKSNYRVEGGRVGCWVGLLALFLWSSILCNRSFKSNPLRSCCFGEVRKVTGSRSVEGLISCSALSKLSTIWLSLY